MRSTRPAYFTIVSLFLILLTTNVTAWAADDDDADEYDVKARVVRISFIAGVVTLKRSDSNEVENARVNSPLVEGDVLSTDHEGRVEIQIDARNFLRLGGDSVLQITTLRDEGIALSLSQGTASIKLAKFDHDHEYFEIDAPKTTLAAEKEGQYRLDVSSDGRVRMTARSGGRARIYSETSGFVLRDGRTAELINDGPDTGDWEFTTALAADAWDTWVDDRDRYLAERMHYDTQYYDNALWGAEDLDAYGTWINVDEYGWVWQPNAGAINSYSNWAPYRYGSWVWLSPYGWTWVGNEPWGWAPYHYGRWVYYNNHWAWCPRSEFYRRRSWWRPALVAFVNVTFSFGDNYCWYPLHYHQRDPHSRNYEARNRRHDRDDRHDWNDFRRHNPADHRGVSYIPRREWGNDHRHLRAADDRLAQRAFTAEPLATDLPGRLPARARVIREPSQDPVTAQASRRSDFGHWQTGAGTRHAGVPLDNDLRHSRIFNGRDAQPDFPVTSAGAGVVERRPIGAVTRPGRQTRGVDPRNDSGRDAQRDADPEGHPANSTSERNERHPRPPRGVDPRGDTGRDAQ